MHDASVQLRGSGVQSFVAGVQSHAWRREGGGIWGVWVPMSLVLDGHWLAFHKSHGPESQELLWSTYNGSYRQYSITLRTMPRTALSRCKPDYIVWYYFLMRELKCIEESPASLFAVSVRWLYVHQHYSYQTCAGFLCETNTCNHWWCAANLRTAIFN